VSGFGRLVRPAHAAFRRALGLALLLALLPTGVRSEPEAPLALLQGAFDRMFNYPSVRRVSLRIHRADRVTERAFEAAYKRIDGEGRTLLRFSDPPYLRGTRLLVLETPGATSDTWLYQPSWRRVRRVSTGQKGDSFFGSDLTFEDLEHHDWSRWALRLLPDAEEEGRLCRRVEATPRVDSQYARIVAWIDPGNGALARVDFHRTAAAPPFKSLLVPAGEVEQAGGVLLTRRIWFRVHGRDAATEVHFERIERDPRIADSVFSAARLEHGGRDLFAVVERLREAP
jgi:hypothetical protein